MSVRHAANPEAIRASVTIQRAAALLDCAENTVRSMLKNGELHGFRLRGRVLRVYEDSVADYQLGNETEHKIKDSARKAPVRRSAEQREAENYLRQLGCL